MSDENKNLTENTPDDEALESFLSREPAPDKKKKSNKKSKRNLIILLACAAAVIVLVTVIIILNNQPYPKSEEDLYRMAEIRSTVDEQGIHEAEVPTDDKGDPRNNGEGKLIDYTPSDISSITVNNADGVFVIIPHHHADQATDYTLDGLEDFPLQTGMPDNVANDAAAVSFSTIAGVGKNPADFGLDEPRATVKVGFSDGTYALIKIGSEAPASAGTYISFGNSDTVYLVSDDSVDSFFYKTTDFISLTVTDAAETVEDGEAKRLTLSGTHYPQSITIEPNTDEEVNYSYKVTSPRRMYASPYASANITGTIRDLYAEEVVAIRPTVLNMDDFLQRYGLMDGSYSEVIAEYPDKTVHLRASAPDSDGNVYLVNSSGGTLADRIVYKIQVGAVSWVSSSLSALVPDTVLRVNREALSAIEMTADGKTYKVKVDVKTEQVENDQGETEDVVTCEAYYNDKRLSDESFSIFFQNLSDLPNSSSTDGVSGSKLLEIRYSYNTGRSADSIVIYDNGTKSCPVTLNGEMLGVTSKSYAAALTENIKAVAKGETPATI